ncbi:ankyrin repeat domain-containing protein 63 isoform X2 [Protopterus annectens]|uniref:ankyrin repeat domain-containing protein 63 isoform X2 n=1 Tax=Protopterus annectens TaxID=7888 RepID=UPI001CF9F935|nr:ankyrin repeat domain-containing protein 63 isoform X2 [Protopterus annectens]
MMIRPKDLCQSSGTKTFLEAMQNGKVHLARFVLDALDCRILNSRTEQGKTPLMFAVTLSDPGLGMKFTRLLLEKGADVNGQDEHGRTALSYACELGYLEITKLLVQFGADPEVPDIWGNSPLMYAASSGHKEVLEFLIKAFKRLGLKLDSINQAGHSAEQIANFFGHSHCVETLNTFSKKRADLAGYSPEMGGSRESRTGTWKAQRRPNRLPLQVLERFSKPFHSSGKSAEEHLTSLFNRQARLHGQQDRDNQKWQDNEQGVRPEHGNGLFYLEHQPRPLGTWALSKSVNQLAFEEKLDTKDGAVIPCRGSTFTASTPSPRCRERQTAFSRNKCLSLTDDLEVPPDSLIASKGSLIRRRFLAPNSPSGTCSSRLTSSPQEAVQLCLPAAEKERDELQQSFESSV